MPIERIGQDFIVNTTTAGAQIVPKLLPEQQFNVGFIIDHKNKQVHACPPDFAIVAAARGRRILNSVNLPGSVSTSIEPACCLTMIS